LLTDPAQTRITRTVEQKINNCSSYCRVGAQSLLSLRITFLHVIRLPVPIQLVWVGLKQMKWKT